MLLSSLGLVAALAAPSANAEGLTWVPDVAKAKELAKAEGKHLLINFTGSDWCGWCHRLDDEVFAQEEFITTAEKDYVFVYLDFPNAEELKAKVVDPELSEKLQGDYAVSGFPTIVLADATGRPYAKTGYQEGGPQKYLEHMAGLREAGQDVLNIFSGGASSELGQEGVPRLEERVEKALPILFEQALFAYPGYDQYLEMAKTIDADGTRGWKAKALAYEQSMKLEELAREQLQGESPPDWTVLATFLVENEHCSGQMFVQIAMMTATQHLMPNEMFADARALFVRVKAEPMLAEVEEAQTELGQLIADCDARIAAKEADAGAGEDGDGGK